jgi:CRISPR-associated protein Csd1
MIIDKISNGRVSIKYFRELYRSDLYKRVEAWYHSTKWGFYSARQKEIVQQSPSIYTIADYILGTETEEKNRTTVVCNNKKMRVKTIERLIPCIIDGKKIPLDLVNRMFNNLCKRSSYGKTWSSIVQVGCSLLKKYKLDYKLKDEVKEMLEENNKDRSYLYGRLLAIYEKLEADTLYSGTNEVGNRSTNAERLWTAYTKTPARTLMILEEKIRPYKERLQKGKPSSYIYYERLIGKIINDLSGNENFDNEKNNPLNEDFVFGYYAQKQDLYKKKSEDKKDEVLENMKEVY